MSVLNKRITYLLTYLLTYIFALSLCSVAFDCRAPSGNFENIRSQLFA